jgi:hypothetical protein
MVSSFTLSPSKAADPSASPKISKAFFARRAGLATVSQTHHVNTYSENTEPDTQALQ